MFVQKAGFIPSTHSLGVSARILGHKQSHFNILLKMTGFRESLVRQDRAPALGGHVRGHGDSRCWVTEWAHEQSGARTLGTQGGSPEGGTVWLKTKCLFCKRQNPANHWYHSWKFGRCKRNSNPFSRVVSETPGKLRTRNVHDASRRPAHQNSLVLYLSLDRKLGITSTPTLNTHADTLTATPRTLTDATPGIHCWVTSKNILTRLR